jgi:hypothetical protein
VAAVVYIDPGNSATTVVAGAGYGYSLASVIVAANLMALLVQYLFAKVGVATELNMPELCRKHVPRPAAYGLGGAGGRPNRGRGCRPHRTVDSVGPGSWGDAWCTSEPGVLA